MIQSRRLWSLQLRYIREKGKSMDLVKILLLICILLVYPLFPGSFVRWVLKKKNTEYGLGTMYVAGVLSCGVFFGTLAFFGVRFGVSLDLFSKAALVSALLILIFCIVLLFVIRGYRNMFVKACSGLKKKPAREDFYIAFAFVLVAALYLLDPFSVEPTHDTAEKVVTIVDTGRLAGTDPLTGMDAPIKGNWKDQLENLPLIYAMLCRWTGLSPAQVLFDVVPYVVLFFAFCVISTFVDVAFEKHKMSRAASLMLFALITLCGNVAYMNTSYGLLHYPYEAMTIFSSILLPLAFFYAMSRERMLLILCVWINAVFAVGAQKAAVILGLQIICYVAAYLVYRFAERRDS